MIKITAKVKIYEDSDGIINGADVQTATAKINVASDISGIVGATNTQTRNVFMLADTNGNGGSTLDGSTKYANTKSGVEQYDENFYASGSVASTVGTAGDSITTVYNFANPIDILIEVGDDNKLPNQINLLFDESNGRYPVDIDLLQDGAVIDSIVNKTALLTISGYDQTKAFVIRIKSMNKQYAPLIITAIYANLYYDITDKKMISCEFELNEKADPTLPSFGVISNDGSIEFRDYDGSFLELIEQGRLKDKKEVVFELENTYDKKKREISTFLTSDVQYDDDSQIADIQLIDNLVAMQDVKDVRVYLQKNKTMLDVYHTLVELSTPLGYTFADIDNDEEFADLKAYLTNITLQYFFLKSDTLWAQWQKFCEATGLYMYINKENKIVLGSEFDFSMEA